MQAPEESAPSASVYPPEPLGTARSPHHQWLSSQPSQKSHWQWQHIGGAITGTAVVSAGLAAPYAGKQAISVPVREAYLSPQTAGHVDLSAHSKSFTQAVAFDQGQAIRPSVGTTANRYGNQAQQALFSQPSQVNQPSQVSQPSQAEVKQPPQLIHNENGGWSLTYTAPAADATGPLTTQAVINQLVTQNRTQQTCLGRACRGLDYIQANLPAAEEVLQGIQQQITDFETQYGQSDLKAYQTVLSDRISEITIQKTQIAVDLADTNRYIGQLKVRLSTLGVAPDLAENLLAADTAYQTQWLLLQRSERQLLKEFSQANVEATALNQIYTQYEQQQIDLYQAAQAVLGNYVLATEGQTPGSRVGPVYIEPAALELLQSLTVAIHQKDVQQLRDRTIQQAQGTLQGRHRELAQNITQYEALQNERISAIAIVTQYQQERANITAAASAATLAASTRAPNGATGNTSTAHTAVANSANSANAAFAVAESLEAQLAEGSIGKTLLAIVIAAGAMAVAAQRRAGDVSAALSLEIAPSPQPNPFGLNAMQKRISNPIQPELLAELIEITRPARPALAAQGVPFGLLAPAKQSVDQIIAPNLFAPSQSQAITPPPSAPSNLAVEQMTHELQEIVTHSEPEVRFAKEVEQRNIDSVRISLDEIDAFAESAVRWVLKDLSSHSDTAFHQERETVDA